ncbi:MAG: TerB family tellurite resistance protein [Paracoccaceae bacterium]
MFQRLLSGLLAPGAPPQGPGAPVALAALLVRLARADGHYSPDESARIDAVLTAHYGLSPFEAVALRQEAEAIERSAPDTVRFTRALKEAAPHDGRLSVLEALWSVALSDGSRDADEDATIRLVAGLLGISDRESALARQRVTAKGERGRGAP